MIKNIDLVKNVNDAYPVILWDSGNIPNNCDIDLESVYNCVQFIQSTIEISKDRPLFDEMNSPIPTMGLDVSSLGMLALRYREIAMEQISHKIISMACIFDQDKSHLTILGEIISCGPTGPILQKIIDRNIEICFTPRWFVKHDQDSICKFSVEEFITFDWCILNSSTVSVQEYSE